MRHKGKKEGQKGSKPEAQYRTLPGTLKKSFPPNISNNPLKAQPRPVFTSSLRCKQPVPILDELNLSPSIHQGTKCIGLRAADTFHNLWEPSAYGQHKFQHNGPTYHPDDFRFDLADGVCYTQKAEPNQAGRYPMSYEGMQGGKKGSRDKKG